MGLVNLNIATDKEIRTEISEMIDYMSSIDMLRYLCVFTRNVYKIGDGLGFQMYLADKNGEKEESVEL